MKKLLSLKVVLLLFLSTITILQAQATHLRGGFITHTADQQNPRKLYFRLIMFSDVASTAQEINVTVYHSDGSSEDVSFSSDALLCDGTRKRTFSWNHTFASNGTYTVHWYGMNRNSGIINMANPSFNLSQYISTTFSLNALRGYSTGSEVLSPLPAIASVGVPFKFNPLAYTTDTDSLAYRLVTPLQKNEDNSVSPVSSYFIPQGMTINELGEINWPNPTMQGEYSVAIQVTKYNRSKIKTSEMTYEVQFFVRAEALPAVTLVNKERLPHTNTGYVFTPPQTTTKLTFFVPKATAGDALTMEYTGDLFEPHLKDRYTFQETERDSADGIVKELFFNFPQEMKRSKPYAVGIRGVAVTSATACTGYSWSYFYLALSDQTVTSLPDPLQNTKQFLYPNPATTKFTVEAPDINSSVLTVYALDGRLAFRKELKAGKNVITRPPYLKPGLYTYTVSSSAQQTSGKLLLQ